MITSHLICNERIAELEAELAALKAAPNYAAQATVECAEYTIDGLLAELAALKARRCETCHYGDDHMLARCRECRFGDMWTTPAEAKPMSGFAKPDPDFTLSPSLTDALRARIAELEAKLSREKESAEIANQQWSEWMTKARAFDALIAVKEEEAETCIVALEKRVQQAETELAVADGRYKAMVKNVAGYEATIETMRGQYTDLMAQLAACDATPSHVLRLEAFHRAVMHHWTCAPDDPRRYRHVLRALLDAIEDAHDEVES